MDAELAEKREEFRKRMEVNKFKKEALKRKQEKIQERVRKFDKFLKDNEAKRTRALYKYQQEVKNNKLRGKELVAIKEEIERLLAAKAALMKRLDKTKKYEEFMSRVVDVIPDGFVPMSGENMIENCIQRYEGLSATRMNIVNQSRVRGIEMEEGHRMLERTKQERYQQQLVFSQEITDLINKQEELVEKNNRLEQIISEDELNRRFMASQLGRTLLAIDNLAVTCHSRHWPPLTEMTYERKLVMIRQRFQEQIRVMRLIQRLREAHKDADLASKLPLLHPQEKSSKPTVIPNVTFK